MKIIGNYKEKLVLGMLSNVPFDGLQWEALYRAAEDLKIYKTPLTNENKIELKNLFENNLVNIIKAFNDYLDDKMEEQYSKYKKMKKRTPEKIKSLILSRFSASLNFKDGILSSLSFMSLPQNSKSSLKMLYNTCDRIWRVSGDQSTDFSFYTKRLILSGVYSSTLMHWINDDSGDLKKTEDFLDRRLENVSKIGKVKQIGLKFKDLNLDKKSFPFKILSSIPKTFESKNFENIISKFKNFK